MSKRLDLTGQKFGYLTAIEIDSTVKNGRTNWKCLCKCGKYTTVPTYRLRAGETISCGCRRYETKNQTHGMKHTRIYEIWCGMKKRCCNENGRSYARYGGRGITVCEEWKNDFSAFYNWAMQNGYAENLTIDRIDNSKGYCPENCRWITNKEQQNNKRNNVLYTYNGETKTLAEWSESLGICYKTLQKRIIKWGVDKAFSTPLFKERIIDLTGQKFGRLYVQSLFDTKHGARFECICDCGNKTIQRGYDLRKGNVVSCGCYQRENASKNMRKWVLNEQT